MDTPYLTFNILTFKHPQEKLTFWFTDKEQENLVRIHHKLAPDEVVEHFDEQEHYYTSFDQEQDGFFPVTKKTSPDFEILTNEEGKEYRKSVKNSAFTRSVLKRYYNHQIHQYFKNLGMLTKPNFINDTEIWIPTNKVSSEYNFFEKYSIKVQIARITKEPEMLITFEGISKVFKKSVVNLIPFISPKSLNWVVYDANLFKYDELPETGKQNQENVFPVWNFDLRDDLNQETEAPEKGNKYKKFKGHIDSFFNDYINIEEFKEIIPVNVKNFIKVPKVKIHHVTENSNILLFNNGNDQHTTPFYGMLKGPFKSPEYSKIQFFYILHKNDKDVAKSLNKLFAEGIHNFHGIYDFAKITYFTIPHYSITFSNKENPLPEIETKIFKRKPDTDVHYIAIYISPHSKNVKDKEQKSIYYKVKELLLKKGITSQAIEAEKVRVAVKTNSRYDYSLNNIAIAILAKLNGIPWQLNTKLKNELIVGVGAFRNKDTNIQYIGSAFSFANNGKFNRFECFQKNQTDELAGSIIRQIQEYVAVNSHITRLIIHFYKNMSNKELEPIEDGLNDLGLDIPVFIITINKTESHDIIAFDNDWPDLMPKSGTIINLKAHSYLLFNNTRYSEKRKISTADGFPFPVKLNIHCTDEELAKDHKIIKELIDQVYQFSRMYWKSVRQQNLPVTIKYPEMVAEIFPHFEGKEIPPFGKDNLWFL